jgi:hypothetical protein
VTGGRLAAQLGLTLAVIGGGFVYVRLGAAGVAVYGVAVAVVIAVALLRRRAR